jgi:hypothetical protein
MKKAFSVMLALLLVSAFMFSQSRETGAIRGTVTDEQGTPLPGVNVTVTGARLMGVRTFVTDANGEFRFPALPSGDKASEPSCGRTSASTRPRRSRSTSR